MSYCCKEGSFCAHCDPGIQGYWEEQCQKYRDGGLDPECYLEAKEVWWEYNDLIRAGKIKREDYAPKRTLLDKIVNAVKNFK